jgi:hypothetical protein
MPESCVLAVLSQDQEAYMRGRSLVIVDQNSYSKLLLTSFRQQECGHMVHEIDLRKVVLRQD